MSRLTSFQGEPYVDDYIRLSLCATCVQRTEIRLGGPNRIRRPVGTSGGGGLSDSAPMSSNEC